MRYKTGEIVHIGDYLTIDYGHMHLRITHLVDSWEKRILLATDAYGVIAYFEEMKQEMFFDKETISGEEADFIERGIAPPSMYTGKNST